MSSLTTLFTNIANAIRTKKGTSATIVASDFPTEIASIPTGITPTGTIPITSNGITDVTNYASADVSVQPNLQSKSQTITTNTTTTFTPDTGYDGLSSVSITTNVSGGGGGFTIDDASRLFQSGSRLNILNDLLPLCSNVTSMANMFYACSNLTSLDLSSFNTGNTLTNMASAFYQCTNLSSLTNLSGINTTNTTNMSNVFYECKALISLDLSNWNTSSATNTSYMFYSFGLSTDTSANLQIIFGQNFTCSSVTNMTYMFNRCNLRANTLDISMFVPSSCTSMSGLFDSCNITSINLGTNFDCGNVANVSYMFSSAYLPARDILANIYGSLKDLGKGYTRQSTNYSSYKLDLSPRGNLTHDSLMNIINGLYDLNLTYNVAGGGTLYSQTLNLGSTNTAKLTAQEIAVATAKGWNVT